MAGEIKARATSLKSSVAIFLFSTALLVLQSCEGTLFHSFRSVEGMAWSRYDTLEFIYSAGGQGSPLACADMSLEVRHSSRYGFKYLTVRAEFLNGCDSIIAVDTLYCTIYDDNGLRNGSTAGILYQQQSEPVALSLPGADTLKIRLSHIMNEELLQGVCDVGVRLVEPSAPCRRQF